MDRKVAAGNSLPQGRGVPPPILLAEDGTPILSTSYLIWVWCYARWERRPRRSRWQAPAAPERQDASWECSLIPWQAKKVAGYLRYHLEDREELEGKSGRLPAAS